jgi:hypothetical protein
VFERFERREQVSKSLGNIPKQQEMSEEQEQTFTNGINKGRKLERELILKYPYPDGFGSGGTFTDGEIFSQDSIQIIIDEVVAKTRADENSRSSKLLETLSHDYDVPAKDNSGDMLHVADFCTACRAIALIKERNK